MTGAVLRTGHSEGIKVGLIWKLCPLGVFCSSTLWACLPIPPLLSPKREQVAYLMGELGKRSCPARRLSTCCELLGQAEPCTEGQACRWGKWKGRASRSLMTRNLFNTDVLIHLLGRSIIHYRVQNPILLSEFAFHETEGENKQAKK